MQHSQDRDGEALDVEDVFADPAFAALKARDAAFAVVRPETREVVWANAAAAAHWGSDEAEALARVLFGASGRGWVDRIAGSVPTGRPPRLARSGLARGFLMRAQTALIRAWTDQQGSVRLGFAVPESAGSGDGPADAWRRPAWTSADVAIAAPADVVAPDRPRPLDDGRSDDDRLPRDPASGLARRGQLAILRDRLNHAVDGAASLRLLWRTDAAGGVTQIDADSFARLGSPVRFGEGALPDVVERFDPAGAARLRSALAHRATWSGITVALPVADAAATAPMTMSGSPIFGPDRTFAGFRGFGIVDLTHLDLAPERARAAVAAPEPAHDPRDVEAPAAEAVTAAFDGSSGDMVEPAGSPELVPPVPDPGEAPSRRANVVQLRAFQAIVSGRFGTATSPVADPAQVEPASPEPTDGPRVDGGAEETEPHLSDDLAFLALGEALRARIAGTPLDDATPPGDEGFPVSDEPATTEGAEPVVTQGAAPVEAENEDAVAVPDGADGEAAEVTTPSSDVQPELLDLLPIALLVIVGQSPVYANAVAARRLGHGSPDAVAMSGVEVIVPDGGSNDAGRTVFRDGDGRTVSVAARTASIAWKGIPATLLMLDDADASEAAVPHTDEADIGSGELIDRIDDAVALLDADGCIRRLNRRGEAWFGRHGAEGAVGRSFTQMLAPESRPAALSLIGEVRAQRAGTGAPPLNRDVLARTDAEAAIPMLLTLGRLGASGFYATLRDVSALKRAEIARDRFEREREGDAGRLSGLLAKVNHEIRTPLNAILGFAEVMMDERFGPLGNVRYRDYLKDIHAAGTQVVAMVRDLLDLSRIEAGQLDLAVAAVDVNRIVAETVAQMQPEAHRERVIMRTSLAGRVPAVLADERSARQIVRNLLSNAVKFNEPGGQVIVSTALSDAGAVLLRVRDTGVGMSDEAIAAALEPFGSTATARPADGNGLGLPLTRALVGANGASMAIRSRPREGTLVEVAFTSAGAEDRLLPA